ncbi:hypothetical protein [Paenibacillus campi]|uniref:hypothetical protein n=1 Tax=Paenibacillus campi TaxID=3106031 RepID=UPI002AFFB44F|nr:hypothetical protein [Paenibacillus sp. SGZ-1009]
MKYWLLRRPFTPVAAIPAATAFARQLAERHKPTAMSSAMPGAALVHRRIAARDHAGTYEEIHHHHHQRIEWKPLTQVSITQPLLVRNYYFWRLLALEGQSSIAALPRNEVERGNAGSLSTEGVTAGSGGAWGAVPPALWQMLWQGGAGRLPPEIWLEAHSEQAGAATGQSLPLSLRVLGSLPQLIFRQMAGGMGSILTGGMSGDTAFIQPYEWTLDTRSFSHIQGTGSWSRRNIRELSRLVPLLEQSGGRAARIGALAGSSLAPRLRWLPPVRLTIPVRSPSGSIRPEGDRQIRRLSDLFQVSRLSELDSVLGGTYTVQLLNVLPSPEQTAAALPYPSWQPLRQEPAREPEDWLYHIVRLFNPHERRAVIEHNIRRLYQRAAERSFHQQAGKWSRMVMTAVRQEWRRQSPAGTPVAGMPEQLIRRQGNRWLWNQAALAGGAQWKQASQRLREWWPWLNLPWLQSDSADEALRRELYHPLLLRRYLGDEELASTGATADTRLLQGNIYETLGRYIERETLRLSPERFMMLLPLAAALPGQTQSTSLRQLARERARAPQRMTWASPLLLPMWSVNGQGMRGEAGITTTVSTLIQRITGRELSGELLRPGSASRALALRFAGQAGAAASGRRSTGDLQLEASRWLMQALQAEQRSAAAPLRADGGLSPERMLLAFRRSESNPSSADTVAESDAYAAYTTSDSSTRRSGVPLLASTGGRGIGLPLSGAAEPAMLEMLRRRIQQLPERMLTGEQGQAEASGTDQRSPQGTFVPEWRRTAPAVSASSSLSSTGEDASARQGNRAAATTTGTINAAMSDSESALAAARQPVRLGSNELEQIVQRVYRELQRRLKSDYQRRGM